MVIPWRKYEYVKLIKGVQNFSDIFQEKINELLYGVEFINSYIDNLLKLTRGYCTDY